MMTNMRDTRMGGPRSVQDRARNSGCQGSLNDGHLGPLTGGQGYLNSNTTCKSAPLQVVVRYAGSSVNPTQNLEDVTLMSKGTEHAN